MNTSATRSCLQARSIGSGSTLALASLGLSHQQQGAEAVQVACDHGQRDIALGQVLDQRHGHLIVGLVLHDAMVEDETVLVFAHRHPYTQLHRHAGLAEARGNTWLHPPRPHLAEPMAEAGLAIGAGGATTSKRGCSGLPSLVVSIAENQRAACEALASEPLIAYLGHKDAMMSNRLRLAQQALLDAAGQRQRLSAAGAELVDGQGVEPVVTLLIAD